MASSLVVNPRRPTMSPLKGTVAAEKTYPSRWAMRLDTKLKNRNENNEGGDDFASFRNSDQGEDEGRRLAREFYQELQYRRGSKPLHESEKENRSDSGAETIPKNNAVRVRASTRRTFTIQPTPSSSRESSSLFSLLPFFSFPAMAPRPAASAGLFSGSGTTVYSPGRSIRAEIELLETTSRNNDARNNDVRHWSYVGTPEQLDDVFRLIALSLIVLPSAYVVAEASGAAGMTEIMTWEDAAACAYRLVALMNDGMSGVVIGVGNGDVFVGEDAAWLMRESSELAAIVVDAVRSVERLVLS
ncbi:hypothetical protein ACHAW5_004008 [Stephanodiscus triporus]|uniref:Uncharacterized protein n=1 Tax=Stephanodiscus triporus TaxID=2934178 RepID=A0ABD3Q573_9STRA